MSVSVQPMPPYPTTSRLNVLARTQVTRLGCWLALWVQIVGAAQHWMVLVSVAPLWSHARASVLRAALGCCSSACASVLPLRERVQQPCTTGCCRMRQVRGGLVL